MNQSAQGNNPDTSANIQEKRKRGRPRKYPKIIPENNARVPKIQGIENAGGPPGFGGVNGNQPRPVAVASVDTNNFMVGKAVSGVIEAVFDAGYLLSVRVADSDTTLRGVVFKPGRFVPISAENDVAPNLQMIRRNEIPIPTEHHNPRPGERKEQQGNLHRDRAAHSFSESPVANQVPRAGSYPANNVTSKGKPVPSVAVQTAQSSPAVSRGNLVPVVLEPPKVSNGLPVASEPTPIATEASHLPASKGKQVQEAANKSNGSTPTTKVPKYASEANFSQLQANHHLVSELYPNEIDPCNQPSTEKLLAAEAVSMRLPDVPLHKLVTDVFKRVEVSSDLTNSPSRDGKTLVQDENRPDDVNQALAIEPLQTVQPNESNPASAPKLVENDKTSKMSQLLEVLQGKMTEPAKDSHHTAVGGKSEQGN